MERMEGYKPVLTPEGLRHPIFRFSAEEGEDEEIWKRLRPMYWWSDVGLPKRAAEVLAVHPTARARSIRTSRPSATNRRSGRRWWCSSSSGLGGACSSASTRRVRYRGFREDQLRYNQFWIQTVRYLSGSGHNRVELLLDREEAVSSRRADQADSALPRRRTAAGQGCDGKGVGGAGSPAHGGDAVVRTVELTKIEGSRASYGAVVTQTPEGQYTFVVTDPPLPTPRPSTSARCWRRQAKWTTSP